MSPQPSKPRAAIRHINPRSIAFAALNGIAVIALYFVVDYTSPLYPPTYSLQDSSIFRLVGKVWAEGGLPYVDIWDHKGPLIFFTNMLGAKLGDPLQGVFYVNLFIIAITAALLWQVVVVSMPQSSTLNQLIAFWFTMAMLAAFLYGIWDLSEIPCFPFLAASLWLAFRDAGTRTFLPSKDGDDGFHVSPLNAYIQGLAVSACFLTRLTNAVAVVGTVLVLAIMLITRRRWANLTACLGWGLIGFSTLSAPFAVYFALHGAFGDFIYGTIGYNMSYAAASQFFSYGIKAALALLTLPTIITIAAVISMWHRRVIDAAHMVVALSGVLSIVLFARLEPFPHYYTVIMFLLPTMIDTVNEFIPSKRLGTLAMAIIMIILPFGANRAIHRFLYDQRYEFKSPAIERIAKESHGSVALYDIDPMAYLRYDIAPAYPRAFLQDWQAKFSTEYQQDLHAMYEQPRTEYLIVNDWGQRKYIEDILDTKYQLVEQIQDPNLKLLLVYKVKNHQ